MSPETYAALSAAISQKPTPWTAMKGKNDIKIYDSGAKPSGGAIAALRIPDGHEDQAWAYARLIAAAPDLLAALVRLVEDAAGPHDPECWEPSRPYAVAISAIIKATWSAKHENQTSLP